MGEESRIAGGLSVLRELREVERRTDRERCVELRIRSDSPSLGLPGRRLIRRYLRYRRAVPHDLLRFIISKGQPTSVRRAGVGPRDGMYGSSSRPYSDGRLAISHISPRRVTPFSLDVNTKKARVATN
jgi:hypothetical protein